VRLLLLLLAVESVGDVVDVQGRRCADAGERLRALEVAAAGSRSGQGTYRISSLAASPWEKHRNTF
jgi:hypothetical protein